MIMLNKNRNAIALHRVMIIAKQSKSGYLSTKKESNKKRDSLKVCAL